MRGILTNGIGLLVQDLGIGEYEQERRSVMVRKILDADPHVLKTDEEILLFKTLNETKDGALQKEIRNYLSLSYQGLVREIARGHIRKGLRKEDLYQEGNLGLLAAIDTFDYKRGNRFSDYAPKRIWQAMARAAINKGYLIRVPVYVREKIIKMEDISQTAARRLGREPEPSEIAKEMFIKEFGRRPQPAELAEKIKEVKTLMAIGKQDILKPLPESEEDAEPVIGVYPDLRKGPKSPEEEAEDAERKDRLRAALSALSVRERLILKLHFGIGTTEKGKYTLREIGRLFGVSREAIRQAEKKAIEELNRHMSMEEMPEPRRNPDDADMNLIGKWDLKPHALILLEEDLKIAPADFLTALEFPSERLQAKTDYLWEHGMDEKRIGEKLHTLLLASPPELVIKELNLRAAPGQASSPVMDEFDKGGIDLNPAHLDLRTAGEGMDFDVPIDLEELENMHIDGFTPVIFQIVPMTNLPMFLGLDGNPSRDKDDEPPGNLSFINERTTYGSEAAPEG